MILRPWREKDAAALYKYAKDPKVGPNAGWPIHTSVENSREILKDVLMQEECFAVVLKGETEPVSSIGLLIKAENNLAISLAEGEISYWIGVPYWGQGLIPEATHELMRHGFCDLKLGRFWCAYFDGNEKSKRVQEKCGFIFRHTEYEKEYPRINAVKTLHVTCITKEQWEENMLRPCYKQQTR